MTMRSASTGIGLQGLVRDAIQLYFVADFCIMYINGKKTREIG